MTRLIYVDDDLVMVLEATLPAGELVQAVQSPTWQPPPALAAILGPRPTPPLRAVRLGQMVILSPAAPHTTIPRTMEVAPGPGGRPGPQLSPRQRQVLQGMADDLTSKEIATQLGVHVRTVELHIAAIKCRFGTSGRMRCVLQGVALGLCKVHPEPK